MADLDKFNRITNYDLNQYLSDYYSFLEDDMSDIVSYYNGNSNIKFNCFFELKRLFNESSIIEDLISNFDQQLSEDIEFWDLIISLSEIRTKLQSIINLSKWMRSSYVFGYENGDKYYKILKQHQTFEELSYELGSNTSDDDWAEISVSNIISEIDYTDEGGNKILISDNSDYRYSVTSVVDVMVGDNILGKDMYKKLTIDNSDIKCLTPIETVEQSADICLSITKGSVPEYFNLGVPKDTIGSNVYNLKTASIVRNILENFRTDDAFSKVEFVDSYINEDSTGYNFNIYTRIDYKLNKTL